jgi:SET domain-containing protein
MPLLEKQLIVKRSTLKGAGKGLFTTKDIPKGKKIVEYTGVVSTWKDVDDRKGLNGYIYYVNRNHVINAWGTKESLARYANDARGLLKSDGLKNNCTYNIEGVRVYIIAMRDIPAGGELFVGYGKEYWDIIKENWKVKEKEDRTAKKKKEAKKKK